MWGSFITFAEDFIIGQIEANANHPDKTGWIQTLLGFIIMVGSSKLEAYAEPKLAHWIESATPGTQQALMQMAIQAIEKRGGEIGKIVTAADAIAVADLKAKVEANAAAITTLQEGHASNVAAIAAVSSPTVSGGSADPTSTWSFPVPVDPTPVTEPTPGVTWAGDTVAPTPTEPSPVDPNATPETQPSDQTSNGLGVEPESPAVEATESTEPPTETTPEVPGQPE
jgi:hypothetical protein